MCGPSNVRSKKASELVRLESNRILYYFFIVDIKFLSTLLSTDLTKVKNLVLETTKNRLAGFTRTDE